HKLCDTITASGMRRMRDAVHLADLRCDGSAHGGCQAGCLIYWKEAWLRRAPSTSPPEGTDPTRAVPAAPPAAPRVTVADLHRRTRREPSPTGEELWSCQATELLRAAPELLPLRHLGQYVVDVRSGNIGPLAVLRALLVGLFNRAQAVSTRVLPPRLRFREGRRWGFVRGTLTTTPTGRTDLQPGELVRIRSKDQIMATLDRNQRNRGLGFEEEMARHCGREARVLRRVERCIDEGTGRLLEMRNPCIVLDGIVCEGAYNANCPRSIPAFWREIWLERVEAPQRRAVTGAAGRRARPADRPGTRRG